MNQIKKQVQLLELLNDSLITQKEVLLEQNQILKKLLHEQSLSHNILEDIQRLIVKDILAEKDDAT